MKPQPRTLAEYVACLQGAAYRLRKAAGCPDDIARFVEEAAAMLIQEAEDAGNLADAVGRYIDGGRNDEEGLRAALSAWAQRGSGHEGNSL